MAMPKARYVLKVNRGTSHGAVVVRLAMDPAGHNFQTVELAALTLRELIRAAMNVRLAASDVPGSTGIGWRGCTVEALRAAIAGRVWRDGYEPREWGGADPDDDDMPDDIPAPADVPADVIPANVSTRSTDSAPVAAGAAPADPLAAVIAEAVRGYLADAVSADAVTDIVRQVLPTVLEDMPGARGGVTVRYPDDREPRTLPGTVHEVFPTLWTVAVTCRRFPWLYGPRGTGKSTVARTLAAAMGVPCSVMSVTADMGRHSLEGFMSPGTGEYVPSTLRRLFDTGEPFVYLLDEIGFGTPEFLGCLNDMTASREYTFPDGVTLRLPDGAVIAAADNTPGFGATAGFGGRVEADAATADRFEKVYMGIDPVIERAMLAAEWDDAAGVAEWADTLARWRENADRHRVESTSVRLTPRGAASYAAFRAAGMSHDDAAGIAIFGGVSADIRAKVVG